MPSRHQYIFSLRLHMPYFFGVRRLLIAQIQRAHRTRPWVHESFQGRRSSLPKSADTSLSQINPTHTHALPAHTLCMRLGRTTQRQLEAEHVL